MLYQKHRPSTLDEVIGNSVTVGGLRAILRSPNKPHVFLFKGPRGMGKTTLARIMAKELGASENSTFEYNAGNTRGIDTVRDIIEHIPYASLDGKVKVYILDESHELTSGAQGALKKVLEDVPEHCYFILCAISPENIIKEIRSRCAEYEVSKLSADQIMELLNWVCEKEGFKVNNEILSAIAYVCGGCAREALVSLEKVASIDDTEVAIQLIIKGTEGDVNVINLCNLLMMNPERRKEQWRKILDTFFLLSDEPEKIRKSLLTYFTNKLRTCKNQNDALDIASLISNFTISVYYTGQAQLAAQITMACLGK